MLEIEKKYWDKGIKYVAGIDEAGRGPLAGPVVAASVIFNPNEEIEDIRDSKKLSDKKRNYLFDIITEKAVSIGVGIVHEDKIDEINILKATFLAMNKSIGELNVNPEQILVDGPYSNIKLYSVEHIINGDNLSQSIAAASIIAKVTRDRLMKEYDKIFSEYGFSKHKGYGTKLHIKMIKKIKSSPIHRKSFKIVNENIPNYSFFKKNKHGLNNLGNQIIATKYVRNKHIFIDKNIEFGDITIDYCFLSSVTKKLLFIKTIVKNNSNNKRIDEYKNLDKSIYKHLVDKYIKKNNYDKKYSFSVISIEFTKSKKPIINIL